MAVMRYNVIDADGTISFIAPWNTLKPLLAACSKRPAPETAADLLRLASVYHVGLQEYVLNGLALFDEHYQESLQRPDDQTVSGETGLNSKFASELDEILAKLDTPDAPLTDADQLPPEITYRDLLEYQRRLRLAPPAKQLVSRVVDAATREETLQPVSIGLVIFNLPAKRIIQVVNKHGAIQRSDRGRYFENDQPSQRTFFYRLPKEWTILP
jgi:hypothetical protein